MKSFEGKILFLDRKDINTDEIIPAKYLTEISKRTLGPHLLEDLKMEGFDPERDLQGISVIAAKENFGCGSSREHAPWALEERKIHLVIAPSFARIFKQNMFNCGMIPLLLTEEEIETLFTEFQTGEAVASLDLDKKELTVSGGGKERKLSFTLGSFDEELVRAGGWVNYASERY